MRRWQRVKEKENGMENKKNEYKTGYSNPACKCRAAKDCSKGRVNSDGLCKNCTNAYPKKRSAK